MSEVKVNKITPTANCGTVTLGDSGDTIAIPAGVTLTSGGALQNSGTITNTGTITGVAITGTIDNQVNWQTTVKTSTFTASAGEGYFLNTTSGAFTINLPASPSAGDLVGIKDYANTADTNNITISVEGGSITLIFVDATKGWLSTAAAKASDIITPEFVTATGGTITTSGDFKIHTFTGPGTFCVSNAGNPAGSEAVDYLVVAGAGGGGTGGGGGAGAGGYRTTFPSPGCNAGAFPISATAYPITVGGGGTGGSFPVNPSANTAGSNSIFSTITSAGGGKGGNDGASDAGTGGSGGGGGQTASSGAAGNTPPVSPPQGNPGGNAITGSLDNRPTGGGGGAGATGTTGVTNIAGGGGAGLSNSITGSSVGYAGGGGGGTGSLANFAGSTDPTFGGGPGGKGTASGTSGTANRGSGGGGGAGSGGGTGGGGGSGIVVIRYKFQ